MGSGYTAAAMSEEAYTLHDLKCPNPECKKEFQLKRPAEPDSPMESLFNDYFGLAKRRKVTCPHCGRTFKSEKPML
jgi:hypothetical protein